MQHFQTISKLISSYNELAYPGRIYAELNKKTDFWESQFWVLSSKESKDAEWVEYKNNMIPALLVDCGAVSFIDTGTFQDIIKNKLDSHQAVSVINDTEMFIEAICRRNQRLFSGYNLHSHTAGYVSCGTYLSEQRLETVEKSVYKQRN